MDDFMKNFEAHLRGVFLRDLQASLEKVQGEKIYAMSFITDDDWITLGLVFNTEESLEKHLKDMKEESPCADGGHFDHISKLMRASEGQSFSCQNEIVECLSNLVNEVEDNFFQQFDQNEDEIIFFVSNPSDPNYSEHLENSSVRLMHSRDTLKKFARRYN